MRRQRHGADPRMYPEGEYRPSGAKKYLYLTDHLGSVRDVIDIAGTPTLVAAFDYTPYGAVARSWGTVAPLYQYAMLVAAPNSGLYLSATRAYNPTNGKWLNTDTIREAGGINMTGYGFANPLMNSDPFGTNSASKDQNVAPVVTGARDVYDLYGDTLTEMLHYVKEAFDLREKVEGFKKWCEGMQNLFADLGENKKEAFDGMMSGVNNTIDNQENAGKALVKNSYETQSGIVHSAEDIAKGLSVYNMRFPEAPMPRPTVPQVPDQGLMPR